MRPAAARILLTKEKYLSAISSLITVELNGESAKYFLQIYYQLAVLPAGTA